MKYTVIHSGEHILQTLDDIKLANVSVVNERYELVEKIAAEDKARRDQEQSIANAQADAAHAQSIIEQANEVHDHPAVSYTHLPSWQKRE